MEPSKLLVQLSLSLLLPIACWSDCWSQTTHKTQHQLLQTHPRRLELYELYFKSRVAQDKRREAVEASKQRRKLGRARKMVAELIHASYQLQKMLLDPNLLHVDTPKLADKCEDLSKDIKRLLR